MGAYAASVIMARVEGACAPPPFRYRHEGSLATIGRNNAVADLGWITLTGWSAWLVWSVAHIFFLIGFRSRIVVALDWFWAYVTYRRGARIILAETAGATADCQPMPPTCEYGDRRGTGPAAQSEGRGP
jgi:NADH:ubiquinone reductase (H+-translocating)